MAEPLAAMTASNAAPAEVGTYPAELSSTVIDLTGTGIHTRTPALSLPVPKALRHRHSLMSDPRSEEVARRGTEKVSQQYEGRRMWHWHGVVGFELLLMLIWRTNPANPISRLPASNLGLGPTGVAT